MSRTTVLNQHERRQLVTGMRKDPLLAWRALRARAMPFDHLSEADEVWVKNALETIDRTIERVIAKELGET